MPPSSLLHAHARRAETLDRLLGALQNLSASTSASTSPSVSGPAVLNFASPSASSSVISSTNVPSAPPTPPPQTFIEDTPSTTPSSTPTTTGTTTGTTAASSSAVTSDDVHARTTSTSVASSAGGAATPSVTVNVVGNTDIPSAQPTTPSGHASSPSESSIPPSSSPSSESSGIPTDTATLTTLTTSTSAPPQPSAPVSLNFALSEPHSSSGTTRYIAFPTSLPLPPSAAANTADTVPISGAAASDVSSKHSKNPEILAGIFGAVGGISVLLILFICYRRSRARRSSASSIFSWSAPSSFPEPVSSSQYPTTPSSGGSSHAFVPTPTSPNSLARTHTHSPSLGVLSSPASYQIAPSPGNQRSQMSQFNAARNTISPLLIVRTSRFSAQNGRYTFDTSPTRGKDSPVVDPFADPYARMRRTIFEQPETSAESPTIRAGPELPFFMGGSGRMSGSSSPLAGLPATMTTSPTEAEGDLSSIGLAAMGALETPKYSPGYLGPDPFGTPKSHRLSNLSLDADVDVDVVITPPSPIGTGFAA